MLDYTYRLDFAVELQKQFMDLIADSVSKVRVVENDWIEPLPSMNLAFQSGCISGVGKLENRLFF